MLIRVSSLPLPSVDTGRGGVRAAQSTPQLFIGPPDNKNRCLRGMLPKECSTNASVLLNAASTNMNLVIRRSPGSSLRQCSACLDAAPLSQV